MLLDLLSSGTYNRYNIKIAHIIGLTTAVYLEELLDINRKAYDKNKIEKINVAEEVPFGTSDTRKTKLFFTVDRNYISKRTTITPASQIQLDEKLEKVRIISKITADGLEKISIDLEMLTTLLIEQDEKLLKDISTVVKRTNVDKKDAKQQCISNALKSSVLELLSEPEELKQLYFNYIDAVISSPNAHYLTKPCLQTIISELLYFCNGNNEAHMEIVKYMLQRTYAVSSWGIQNYIKTHNLPQNTKRLKGHEEEQFTIGSVSAYGD